MTKVCKCGCWQEFPRSGKQLFLNPEHRDVFFKSRYEEVYKERYKGRYYKPKARKPRSSILKANLTDGGEGGCGRVLTAETRAKISLARKTGGPVNPRPITHPNAKKTHCPQGHEFTPENTGTKGGGRSGRRCKQCDKNKARIYRAGLYQQLNNFK